MINGFAENIIPFAINAHQQIKKGETFDIESVVDSDLKTILKHSMMFRDDKNRIWFSTTNHKIIDFVTNAYFDKDNKILKIFNKSLNKVEITKLMNSPRTTAYRKLDELIKFGFIIKNKRTISKNNNRCPTFCRLFDTLDYTESMILGESNIKFRINKNIFKKDFWSDDK